ncbi:hypothetical protein ACM55F_09400 [Flavobacterium sp. XS2P12]|uniref:hypothetical protein n=1 Tax=Flavobacterium melibiosi TaxID=3398734 RepID=UPI003A85FA1D
MIKKKLRDSLLENGNQNDAELISQAQAQEESEKDIVSKSEDNSIMSKEEE